LARVLPLTPQVLIATIASTVDERLQLKLACALEVVRELGVLLNSYHREAA
jgi:hypothetical protein